MLGILSVAESLRSKTLHALSWSFIESMGVRGVRFAIGIVLAGCCFRSSSD